MPIGELLHVWNQWGVQIMVLVSFALQVFLLAFGGIRRRSSSTVLRIVLWLAYLSADSTAIYTLGHLSVASSRSPEHLLVAFWAPFLLLHLGGPDNITAYALEDNRLWLRHLQTLTVQALGAAYIIYKFIFIGSSSQEAAGTLLLLGASISMFAAGLVKYGERVWALKCGNISSIASRFDSPDDDKVWTPSRRLTSDGGGGEIDKEEMLLRAHSYFEICKGAFTDVTVNSGSSRSITALSKSTIPDLYKLVEMELSLMYDILYTKAAVIHTWYGFGIHFISLIGTVAAALLFRLSIGSSGDRHSRVDVIITYVLLAGALVLETTSLCKATLCTWTCSFLDSSGWKRLLRFITYLRRHVQPASRRPWTGSIGQYNLLDLSASDRNGIVSCAAKKVGLENWWNTLRFSATFSGSKFCTLEDLKVLVLETIVKTGTGMNSNGRAALERNGYRAYDSRRDNVDLDKNIVFWHIVTDLVIRLPWDGEDVDKGLVEATKVLSNYMIFLLVAKPEMLPGRTRRNVYLNACKELDSHWSDCLKARSQWEQFESRPRSDMLADWLLASSHRYAWTDMRYLLRDHHKIYIEGREAPEQAVDVYEAVLMYDRLRNNGTDVKSLKMIFEVWVELMMYVAEHCSRDSHARQLSHGGEFITILWLVVHHLKYHSFPMNPK